MAPAVLPAFLPPPEEAAPAILPAFLPPPEEDAFYHVDLVGLRAETTKGDYLGQVEAVFDHGAGDVLEIGSGPYKGLVVPFTIKVVPKVDVEGGLLIVDPPEGLLEPPENEAKP